MIELIKSKKYLIAGASVLAIAVLAVIIFTSSSAYAEEEFWNVKVGKKTVAVLSTESQAKSVIEKIKQNYVKEGAKVESIAVDPKMTVAQKSYNKSKKPTISSVKEAVNYILTGTKTSVSYAVKKGDSLWSISQKYGLTVDELKTINKGKDISEIFPGDKIKVQKLKPFVTVTTKQTVTSDKKVKYKTIYKESADIAMNTTKVSKKGEYGKKTVTEYFIMENDKVVKTVVKSTKVLKKSVAKVVLKGTGAPDSSDGGTYQGNGQAIVNYACQFIGNPYVYGGASLTGGADCSGFVMAVYQHFGINMPRSGQINVGRPVSYGEAQPGDVLFYGSAGNIYHVAIYAGNGQAIHAVNEGMGIQLTSATYTGGIYAVRRVVE